MLNKNISRKIVLFVITMLFISATAFSISISPLALRVHFLNVGQADCIFIQTPNHQTMLIDAGNNADGPTVTNYLHSHQVTRVDVLVATHPHEDHIGAMDQVVRSFDIGQIYMPKVLVKTRTFEDLLLAIKCKKLTVSTARAGVFINIDPSLIIEMVAPNSDKYEDLNDYSAVTKITYGKTSFLLTGDAGRVSESEMLKAKYNLKADVLKVGHHGSATSTPEAFLEAVSPKIAVISVGAHNDYGHPSLETLARLENRNIAIYRTDLLGTIIATSDGETIKIDKQVSPIKPTAPLTSPTPGVKPTPRQTESIDVTVYITKTGLKYHSAGCKFLARSSIPISLKEAKAKGFTPCGECNPPQ